LVAKYLSNNDKSLVKLFEQLGPLYSGRNGGYLRIVKTVNRKGDNAPMAIVQLLDTDKLTAKELKVKSEKPKVDTAVREKDTKKTVKKTTTTVAKKAPVKKGNPDVKSGSRLSKNNTKETSGK
jgi:large subunit ribosomal protein L17